VGEPAGYLVPAAEQSFVRAEPAAWLGDLCAAATSEAWESNAVRHEVGAEHGREKPYSRGYHTDSIKALLTD
jgi:hypothetical protein